MELLLSSVAIFLMVVGVFYLIRLKGFYLLHPVRVLRSMGREQAGSGISPFRAMTMALAGTLGVGNIVGVASALYLGGAGAVFWMVTASLIAMVLKYAEIVLAMRHRRYAADGEPYGGATYYIEDGCTQAGHPGWGRGLAVLFAVLCIFNAIGVGNILQVNAVAGACVGAFSVPPLLVGIVLGLFCFVVMCGGAKRISALTEKLVPFMMVVFLILSVAVLILRRERIGNALLLVVTDAFTVDSVLFGGLGFLLSRGVRYGVMRGILSNEAGCGTSPMAHASAHTRSAAVQGMWGLVEVFLDTVVLCTVTALVILVSDTGAASGGENAIYTAQLAFTSVLGEWAGGLFAIAVLLFGIATVICWSHYGMTCVAYLAGTHAAVAQRIFTVCYGLAVVYGAVAAPSVVWTLADIVIAFMTILNLLVLVGMHKEVEAETRVWSNAFPKKEKLSKKGTHAPRNGIE